MAMFKKIQRIANDDTANQEENWSAFRHYYAQLMHKIIAVNNIRTKRILILGAGNGNDVPIDYIENYFQEIVIVDIDEKAQERFRAKVKNKNKITAINLDLSGIEECVRNLDVFSLSDEEKIKLIASLDPDPELSFITDEFDIVMNCNYVTQLVGPYFLWRRDKNTELNKELSDAVALLTERIEQKIFEQVAKILSPGGRFIHSTDYFNLYQNKSTGVQSKAYEPVLEAINYNWQQIYKLVHKLPELTARGLNICGSSLPRNLDKLFAIERTEVLNWDFARNNLEEQIYIVVVFVFSNINMA